MSTNRTRLLVVATLVVALTTSSRAQEQTPTWPREPEAPSTPRPPAPPADVLGLVGEYESAATRGSTAVHLYVIERDGTLMTIANRGAAVSVATAVPKPVFVRGPGGRATRVTIGKVVYTRLQVGPEAGGQLRVTPVRSVPEVLKESQTLAPPAETGDFLPSDLVELTRLEPSIRLDVRYATTNNFLGAVFYAEARAFLQRPAAAAVVRVHHTLAALGYGILVHDGYRPWYVTKTFWETTPADRKWLVANPNPGSRHNRGAAVDLTLYDLKTGTVIEMPSTYDESTPRAYAFYPGGTSLQRWHRALLRRVMEAEGFAVNPEEWWHFDYQDWRRYALGNVAFDKIPATRGPGAAQELEPSRALAASAVVEQTAQGTRTALPVLASFDGIGASLHAGDTPPRNPSDNSLAVGPNHLVQIVNSQLAVFTKTGTQYDTTGRVLHGPVGTHTLFAGHGEVCGSRANGDAVVRYDQLASRWLVVMPIFRRAVVRAPGDAAVSGAARPGDPARPGQASDPGPPGRMSPPPPAPPASLPPAPAPPTDASYAICYALSTSSDPLGSYYRYVFERPLFPDYPRPAVWPDGYYVPTSTGDDVIQKHVCVVDRARMLQGQPAAEQCLVVDGVNFLNTADLDGTTLPPAGAPNIVMATGGMQLKYDTDDDGIYVWKVHVDWEQPSRTTLAGPRKIAVTPYRYLCGGQLTDCVPQPGTDRRLDAQGDKLMPRLVYRNIDGRESIVAVHSVDTAARSGGVRWYEFRLDAQGDPRLYQQSTYAPDAAFRWMASPAMDRRGNIAIGYSFGTADHCAGQRFAARLATDSPGELTFHETVLAEGAAAQTSTLRWQDYTQTAVDPSDDCTIWYVGDYLKAGESSYSTRIGAWRMPGCTG